MIKSFFSFSNNPANEMNRLQSWRERILQVLLYGMLLVGLPMYISNGSNFIRDGNSFQAVFVTFAYIWVVAAALVRRIPYTFRAGTVLAIAYFLIWVSFPIYGLSGDGRIWILFFAVFSTIMMGLRAGVWTTIFGTATFVLISNLMLRGIIPMPVDSILLNSTYANGWLTTGITLMFITIVLVFSVGVLIQGLNTSVKDLQTTLDSERNLTEELKTEHSKLERRSAVLEKRVGQIRTAAEISQSIGTILEPQPLLQQVVDLVKERFDLYYVGVFIIDEHNRFAVLTAGTDEAGQKMIRENHRLNVGGSSMVGWATANKKARVALDVGQEAIRFRNPHLPETRSELALPLLIGNDILGALTIQSVAPDAFDDDDIIVLQNISDSLAVALENARLFQQFETSLKEIQSLNRQYLEGAWTSVTNQENKDLTYTKENESIPFSEDEILNSLNIPLTLRDEQVIGNINIEANRSEWSAEDQEFITAVSNQAAIALESARLLEETQLRVERERKLNDLTAKFSGTVNFEELMKTVVQELGQLPNVVQAEIHVNPPDATTVTTNGTPPERGD